MEIKIFEEGENSESFKSIRLDNVQCINHLYQSQFIIINFYKWILIFKYTGLDILVFFMPDFSSNIIVHVNLKIHIFRFHRSFTYYHLYSLDQECEREHGQ